MTLSDAPLLSIILPVYNGEAYLCETLDNLLITTDVRYEIIIINDGSTDASSCIISKYAQNPHIRVYEQSNHGIVASRNLGISLAHGKYLCFCDQDDIMLLPVYFKMACTLETKGLDMGICSTGRLSATGRTNYEYLSDNYYSGSEISRKLIYPIFFRNYNYDFYDNDNYLYGTLWKCIFRKSFVNNNNIVFKRFINYEDDILFVTEALCHATGVFSCSDIGYYWRINNSSESHSHKYVDGLETKAVKLHNYYIGLLSSLPDSHDILKYFEPVNMSEIYMELIENVSFYEGNRSALYKSINTFLTDTDYKHKLECIKFLKKTSIRKYFVLHALYYTTPRIAAFFNRMVRFAEKLADTVPKLNHIERSLKRKK